MTSFLFLVVVVLVVLVARLQTRVQTLEYLELSREARLASLEARLKEWPGPRGESPTPRRARPEEPEPAPTPPPPPRPVRAEPVTPPPIIQAPPVSTPPPRKEPPAPAESPLASLPMPSEVPALPPAGLPAPGREAGPPRPPFDWEALIGVKLFSWVAGIALALGAIFFLRYSVQAGWLQPPVRMALGVLTGAGLLVLCELRAARRYAVTANALDAAGIVILFSTFFAAHTLWGLIPPTATFALLVLVTAVAVLLSIRRDSVFVALLGLVGGFATPALLSTGQDNPVGLFGYLLLLNVGLAWVAYHRRWVVLTALSAAFTALYQWGWVLRFLAPASLGVGVGVFLLFPITAAVFLALLGRPARTGAVEELTVEDLMSGGPGSPRMFEGLVAIQAALPLLFALYLSAVPAYAEHTGLLFGFLLCVDGGLFALARWRGANLLHPLGAATTLLVFLVWWATGASRWPEILGYVALFVVFYLGTGWAVHRRQTTAAFGAEGASSRNPASFAVYAAPLLLSMFGALAATEPGFADPGLPFGVLFALMTAVAAYAIGTEDGVVHFIGSFFALITAATWSAQHLTPARLLPGLAIDAGLSLFYLGVPLLARRLKRELRPGGLSAIVLLASIGLLFFFAAGAVAASALWGLALLLGILNLAILAEGTARRHPILATIGTVLSWLVLVAWWMSGALGSEPVSAMIVTTGFAVLTLGGHLWLRTTREPAGAAGPAGTPLALVGYLFLAFVACRTELSIPPWPLFGVMAVLALAIGVAVLHSRQGEMQLASLAATELVLLLWTVVADEAPWPTVAVWAAIVPPAFGLAWVGIARRVMGASAGARLGVETAAATALVLGQVVLLAASLVSGAPPTGTLLLAHLVMLTGIVALAGWAGRFRLVPVSTVPASVAVATVAVFTANASRWPETLLFATPIYLVYLAAPLLLAGRAGKRRSLHVASVVFSGTYFLAAREALVAGGFGGVIGALPVCQAIALGVLLVHLVRTEPPPERALGRLALVAGAALAFITLAIPVQLEKEWLTIGWALEAAALAWLYTRIPHRGLFWTALGLATAVFVRLALNPEVLEYAPHGATPILNWFLYTYLAAAAAFLGAAWLLARTDDHLWPGGGRASGMLYGAATIVLFLLLNIEIADFFTREGRLTFNFSAGLAQDLTYTLGWAVFALGLLGVGIVLRHRAPRLAAIVLLTVTVFKGFLHDTARLGGLYRVFSFVGLAVSLALVAVVLQKFVLGTRSKGETA